MACDLKVWFEILLEQNMKPIAIKSLYGHGLNGIVIRKYVPDYEENKERKY